MFFQIIYKLQSVHGPDTESGNARIKRMKELSKNGVLVFLFVFVLSL